MIHKMQVKSHKIPNILSELKYGETIEITGSCMKDHYFITIRENAKLIEKLESYRS